MHSALTNWVQRMRKPHKIPKKRILINEKKNLYWIKHSNKQNSRSIRGPVCQPQTRLQTQKTWNRFDPGRWLSHHYSNYNLYNDHIDRSEFISFFSPKVGTSYHQFDLDSFDLSIDRSSINDNNLMIKTNK